MLQIIKSLRQKWATTFALCVCIIAPTATAENQKNYRIFYPSSLDQYENVFLDFSYEQLFMATCEYDDQCLVRHPYVTNQDSDERGKIFNEWKNTKSVAFSRLEDDCSIAGCSAFKYGNKFDKKNWESWSDASKRTCLQIYIHIADDEKEYGFLIKNFTENLSDQNSNQLPSIRMCDALGTLIVRRNNAQAIRYIKEISK